MASKPALITCYEHQVLKVGQQGFTDKHLSALQQYYGSGKTEVFSLVHQGIKFQQFVGVLQVKDLTIEVLPKIDRQADPEQATTHKHVLLQMLRESGMLDVRLSEHSRLRLQEHSILTVYLELFIQECEYLLRHGLVKQYRKQSGNRYALKGALQFQQHIRDNLVHQERFHTRHTVYDPVNPFNQVLYKTLRVLNQFNLPARLQSRLGAILLAFPEMPDIQVDEGFFARLRLHRKTERYRQALTLARLILLNYHPDVLPGTNRVFALMFDMNQVWEQWVLRTLQRQLKPKGYCVQGQRSKLFWESQTKHVANKRLKPDIIIDTPEQERIIIDTKWKAPDDKKGPDNQDLRQLYTYLQYFESEKGILLYPGIKNQTYKGEFKREHFNCRKVFQNILSSEGKAELRGAELIAING
jgi:5-methylcytosine-specific restriction enzyme subunit McrC